DWGDGLKLLAIAQAHEFYAHGVASGFADFFDAGAHHLALGGDEHDLIGLAHGERADHVAGFVAGLHRDDAFAAARLFAVVVEGSAFADTMLARDEEHGAHIDNGERDDVIFFIRANSPDADGVAALVAELLFVEAQAHAVHGDEDELVIPVR